MVWAELSFVCVHCQQHLLCTCRTVPAVAVKQWFKPAAAVALLVGCLDRTIVLLLTFVHASLCRAGTLLGGGGALGDGGAIRQFVPDQQQRQQLFAAVAYDCQCNQQPDEARELFLAAGKPLFALQIINMQLTAAIHSHQGKAGVGT
jgi:hypothetical protein